MGYLVSVSIRWSCVSVRAAHHDRRRIYAQAHSAQTMRGPLPPFGARHPLWAAAPDQKGCTAYGSGAAHPITRTNAESARRRPTQQREDRCTRYGPRHPLRGATPVMSRCTRYEPLHPIRRGAPPTDRVQRTQSQEQTRNLRDDGRHNSARTAAPVTDRDTRYGARHPL